MPALYTSRYNYQVTASEKVDLVAVGLNATDTLISLPIFPHRGSKVEYSTRALQPGGQAASTVVACQTWGLSTRYVGKLGEDDAARLHRDAFAHAGVDAQIVTVPLPLTWPTRLRRPSTAGLQGPVTAVIFPAPDTDV